MVNKETKEMAPVPQFLNIPGLVNDMQHITDTNRGKWFSNMHDGPRAAQELQPVRGAAAA